MMARVITQGVHARPMQVLSSCHSLETTLPPMTILKCSMCAGASPFFIDGRATAFLPLSTLMPLLMMDQ
jgi:hypothetical protein